MLKILVDKRADNGNRFLCRECSNASILSGTQTEEIIYCDYNSDRVKFKVTSCNRFKHNVQSRNNRTLNEMKRTAWILDPRSRTTAGKKENENCGKFIPFSQAVQENLISDDDSYI